jgi:hypothetical protein
VTVGNALPLLVVLVLFGLMGTVYQAGNAVDLAAPFRRLALSSASKRLSRQSTLPATIERTYWRPGEYDRDERRLKALGYMVISQSVTEPHIVHERPGRGATVRTIRRRVPMFRVVYERLQR